MRRLILVSLAVLGSLVLLAQPAAAHPLGNFTVNRASELVVGIDRLRVDHVQDLAEIPTAQAKSRIDTDGDGQFSAGELTGWAQRVCVEAAAGMSVTVSGRATPLTVGSSRAAVQKGVAGLPVLRVECGMAADYPALNGETDVAFRDVRAGDRLGWREVTAVGDRTTLVASDVPADSTSRALTAYPADLLGSPLDQRSASLRVRPGGPAADRSEGSSGPALDPPAAPGTDRLTRAFSSLLAGRTLTAPFLLFAALAAAALGAAHALAPGHGKTVMAFYLAGRSQHSLRSAAAVGATVTATHTAGVLVLGLVITAGTAVAPSAAYPWLTAVSGALIVGVGVMLLREARRPHSHSHSHGHGHVPMPDPEVVRVGGQAPDHHHAGPAHPHREAHAETHGDAHGHRHGPRVVPSRGGLVAMGLAGGLLPSPSALVVFLGAAAMGKAWFGVLLVTAFGAGMALALMATGLAVVHVGRRFARGLSDRHPPRWVGTLVQRIPLGMAAVVCVLGTTIAIRGLAAALG